MMLSEFGSSNELDTINSGSPSRLRSRIETRKANWPISRKSAWALANERVPATVFVLRKINTWLRVAPFRVATRSGFPSPFRSPQLVLKVGADISNAARVVLSTFENDIVPGELVFFNIIKSVGVPAFADFVVASSGFPSRSKSQLQRSNNSEGSGILSMGMVIFVASKLIPPYTGENFNCDLAESPVTKLMTSTLD